MHRPSGVQPLFPFLLQFVALYLRAHNPRAQGDAKKAAARRAALDTFRRDCAAHARVAAAAPRGTGAGAIRALRDGGASPRSSVEDAFKESAEQFDRLASMSRDDLYSRFMK